MPGYGALVGLIALGGSAALAYRRPKDTQTSTYTTQTTLEDPDITLTIDERLESYDGPVIRDEEETERRLTTLNEDLGISRTIEDHLDNDTHLGNDELATGKDYIDYEN